MSSLKLGISPFVREGRSQCEETNSSFYHGRRKRVKGRGCVFPLPKGDSSESILAKEVSSKMRRGREWTPSGWFAFYPLYRFDAECVVWTLSAVDEDGEFLSECF